MLKVTPISTSVLHTKDDFDEFLFQHLEGRLKNHQIVAITSKLVSVAEGRIVPRSEVEKTELIKQQADMYLGEIGYGCHLTVKHGLMVASAGIDESNSEHDDFILYPEDPFASAKRIHQALKTQFGLEKFGVLLTDSHTKPLRRGVVGTALSYYGFRGVKNKVGEEDLFGRELKMTQINVVDALSAAAVLIMGEGAEQTPLAIIETDAEFVEQDDNQELYIPMTQDLYAPLFKNLKK